MDKDQPLLAISHGGNSLTVHGPRPEIGDQPTAIRLVEHGQYEVYLRGPAPQSLHATPRPETARLRYSCVGISHYSLNYGSSVGDVSWTWSTPDGDVVIELEVLPTKLDYREDFAAIKEDLGRLSRLLIADLAGATGASFVSTGAAQQAQLEWAEQARREARALQAAMSALLPRLREQVCNVDAVLSADRLRGRKPARRRDRDLLALGLAGRTVTVATADLSLATALNGHLRWEVDRFIGTGQQVVSADWFAATASPFQAGIHEALAAAQEWRKRLAGIPPVPQLPHLQTRLRDPLYAKAFASLRRLRLGLAEGPGPELLGLKNLWLIYEYWVYLQIVSMLKRRYPIVTAASPSLIRQLGGQLHLVKGIESRIGLRDEEGRSVNCYYNRAFVSLPTTGQKPDITIELLPSGDLFLVDAKYRLGRTPRYLDRYGSPGPEEDDINVMHRYRDAIIAPRQEGRRLVTGGVIAFPGAGQEDYRQHHFFTSWDKCRIAGIPMLPQRIALMEEILGEATLS